MNMLRRIDRAWARGEGYATVATLLLMVFVAGWAAFVRNLTRFDIMWANEMLTEMEWADSLLRKATMWLAFLGASLATYNKKHIGIDVLLMVAPKRAKYGMLAIGGILSGIITFGLAYSFGSAVYLNLNERPIEYEMIGPNSESMHVCDATEAQLAALDDFDKPAVFCVFRKALNTMAMPAETPGAVFQVIVPFMFFIMALRLLAQGVEFTRIFMAGPEAIERAEFEEKQRSQAVEAAVSVRPKPPEERA